MKAIKQYLLNRRINSIFKRNNDINEILNALWEAHVPMFDALKYIKKYKDIPFPNSIQLMMANDNWEQLATASAKLTDTFFDVAESELARELQKDPSM